MIGPPPPPGTIDEPSSVHAEDAGLSILVVAIIQMLLWLVPLILSLESNAFDLYSGAFFLLPFAVNASVIYGAHHLSKRRSRAWALWACIGVALPFSGPCCVIGLPVGFSALRRMKALPPQSWKA